MKTKRIIAGLLAVAVIGGTVSYNNYSVTENAAITASAEETEEYTEETYESLTYKKYSDHIEISDCDESVTEVIIPDEIEGLPVTSIGNSAFQSCKSLTSITIPDSVTSIKSGAFDSCTSLTEIIIPNSVTSIEIGVFSGCSALTEITIPDSITSIGDYAFWECSSLTEINIPDSVTSIGKCAFEFCLKLTEITIPDSVTSIGYAAFAAAAADLTSITIENAECKIYDSKYTIYNGYDENGKPYFNGTIYGYNNSTAQAYAEKYGYNFALMGETSATETTTTTTETTTTTTTTTTETTTTTNTTTEDTATTTTTTTTTDINTELELGDINGDNTIDSLDASLTLADYVAFSSGSAHNFTEEQLKAADVNRDGVINALDASNMLAYYVYTSSGGTDSIEVFLGIE